MGSGTCFMSHTGFSPWLVAAIFATMIPLLSIIPRSTCAQIGPITPTTGAGDLGTIVTQDGSTYNITGGQRPGNGPNLFHSFGEFGVPSNNIANFLNETALPTDNILGRITDGNVSTIFGIIQTTGFGNANLFLMNPAGFLFGPNATVNVGGMVAFTTADYLRLSDGVLFKAPDITQDALLSAAPVAAFGFLGSNPSAIAVQGSQLSVANGTGLSLVGGNRSFTYVDPETGNPASTPDGVTVTGGTLSAPNGQINIASVGSAGEILVSTLQPTPNIEGQTFSQFGTTSISEGSTLDVSGESSGTIRIRSGQFIMDNSFIMANTSIDGKQTALSVHAHDDVNITNGSAIIVTGDATGRVGDVFVTGENVIFDGGAFAFTSNMDATEVGGNIGINSKALSFMNGSSLLAESNGSSAGGTIITSTTGLLTISGSDAFGNVSKLQTVANGSGDGGMVYATAGAANIFNGAILTNSAFTGDAGHVTLNVAGNLNIVDGGAIQTIGGTGASGNLNVMADSISISGHSGPFTRSGIQNVGGATLTGDTTIAARQFLLTEDADIVSRSNEGIAGKLMISATESATIANRAIVRIDTSDIGEGVMEITAPTIVVNQGILQTRTNGVGDGAAINMTADNVTFAGGRINAETRQSSGRGGTVTLNVTDSLVITGQFAGSIEQFPGANIGEPPGPAGIFSTTAATGVGGDINATAGQSITISNGASVSASSTGPGNAGNIQINAGNQFVMTDSSVTTEASQASGGAIKITTTPTGTVHLIDSLVSASVLDGMGGGGSVNIDPQFVILQNSQILANADQGPGGNIFLTTNLLLQDANSVISASSGNPALNGTVTIQSPNAPASGKIQPLGKTPLQATSLLNQHCAALAGGEFSSFTVAGRDSLPTEPGSWLTSPLYAAGVGEGQRVRGEGLGTGEGLGVRREGHKDELPILSLRQIAPAGFLTQAFAVDWSASCQS